MEFASYVEVVSSPTSYHTTGSRIRLYWGDVQLRVGEWLRVVGMDDAYVIYKNGLGEREWLPRSCTIPLPPGAGSRRRAIRLAMGCMAAVSLTLITTMSGGSFTKGLTKMHLGDFLNNVLSESIVRDASAASVAGGACLALGTLSLLFLRLVGRSLAMWGDYRRRAREWEQKNLAECNRISDEERTRFHALERAERLEHRQEEAEIRRRDEEDFAKRFSPLIEATVRAAMVAARPESAAFERMWPPAKSHAPLADQKPILAGSWARFVRDSPTCVVRCAEDTIRAAQRGDRVRVLQVENGRATYTCHPGTDWADVNDLEPA